MKLIVGKLPKNNKNPLLISVGYDQDDDGNCQKLFTRSVAQGSTFEVDDLLGAAIIAQYKGIVKLATASDGHSPAPGKTKVVEAPQKTA